MPQHRRHFFASARGRLLFFNLLVVAVTLMVSGVAVLGFQHASQIQEQVQQQTVDDMTGSMNLARDTANVATAAVRLSQVVGALEYKGEAERLQETQRALRHSLEQLATAPLAQQEPGLVARIIQRSNELQASVAGMLQRGQRRHLERNTLLSSLYQNQSYLRHLQQLDAAQDAALFSQMDRLIRAAIETPTPRAVIKQLDGVMRALPEQHADPLVNVILSDFNQELRKLEPLSAALEIEAQSPAWAAWIDVSQLENAIINLVMNARDAMEGQTGTIKIRTWNQRVTRSDGRRQDMVALEVIDHGCGMSQEVKAQVFEPFFTTKQTGSGSGLGLSMVYGFVRQSGGRVEIESAPGQGTTVRLQLPRAIAPAVANLESVAVQSTASDEKLVLVLEDEADVRQTLCEQLHLLGYLTLEAANGEQAMQMLASSGEIDVLISDLMLPGSLSGVEVINHARKHYPRLTLLLISGQDLRPAHNPALPDVALLRKPFTRAQLAQALRAAHVQA
ncbi:ATP-binding protein [Citrobacter koseri]|nr:ATP-binding protein [Citrobacter koseri]MEB3110868.1 ATP-binding protein [Citrobacter koseri]